MSKPIYAIAVNTIGFVVLDLSVRISLNLFSVFPIGEAIFKRLFSVGDLAVFKWLLPIGELAIFEWSELINELLETVDKPGGPIPDLLSHHIPTKPDEGVLKVEGGQIFIGNT